MPVYLNMYFVKDAAGRKPSFGVNTMKDAAKEANRILTEKANISFPLASEPYVLSYGIAFGDPIDCGDVVGNNKGKVILEHLYRDKAGFATARLKERIAVNVFCVWSLKFADPSKPPDSLTLDHRTILLTNRSNKMGLALAHELGHVLIGKTHTQSSGNLMYGDIREVGEQVSDRQRAVMQGVYKNRAEGTEGWKWEK